MSTWRGEPKSERWSEEKAVRVLLEAGALVGGYEAEGARIEPKLRQTYHDHIVEAHNARDIEAYQEAVMGMWRLSGMRTFGGGGGEDDRVLKRVGEGWRG